MLDLKTNLGVKSDITGTDNGLYVILAVVDLNTERPSLIAYFHLCY